MFRVPISFFFLIRALSNLVCLPLPGYRCFGSLTSGLCLCLWLGGCLCFGFALAGRSRLGFGFAFGCCLCSGLGFARSSGRASSPLWVCCSHCCVLLCRGHAIGGFYKFFNRIFGQSCGLFGVGIRGSCHSAFLAWLCFMLCCFFGVCICT